LGAIVIRDVENAPDTAQWINGNASITQFIDELLTHYLAADTTGSKMCDGCAAS